MKALLANINVLISQVFQEPNGSVSWKSMSLMVAGGADRVQSMPENTVAKYVMRSFGIIIYINKITVENQRVKHNVTSGPKVFLHFGRQLDGKR